ncbi:MAG: acetoacetate decarboxylase family protein [Actinobacteria bacterium]|nr:acetoacetate decarboxylase family protein [Actinomycetota bacterium]MBW3642262.1 acetoacetate decarboxylase family protein [Actinomycetota bacterium]
MGLVAAPYAPWQLSGETLVGLIGARRPAAPLPWGLRPLPGPALVVAAAFATSPVGPYLELAVGEPARLGARPGWCITTMVVDSAASRLGGRLNWGFPKELGTLVWHADGAERELRWVERGIIVRGSATGLPLPVLVPVRTLQRRSDGPVVVPGGLRGRGRLGTIEIDVPEDDQLGSLGGRHLGMHVAGMRILVRPARQPVGLTSTLRAPLRAPEPALSLGTPGRLAQR